MRLLHPVQQCVHQRQRGLEQPHRRAQTQIGPMLIKLVQRHQPGVGQDAPGAQDHVLQRDAPLIARLVPQSALHIAELIAQCGHRGDQLLLGTAQRDLIADLIDIAQRIGALAVYAADVQPDLGNQLAHIAHLLALGQQRQVHQERSPHAGAGIGGTGGEIPQLLVKGEAHLPGQRIVNPEAGGGCGQQIQLRPDGLDAQMVILADHDSHRILGADHRSGGFGVVQQVAGDQPALRHGLAGCRRHFPQPVELEALVLPGGLQRPHRPRDADRRKLGPLGHIEGNILIIAGQPHPGGQHDIMAHQSSPPSVCRRRS